MKNRKKIILMLCCAAILTAGVWQFKSPLTGRELLPDQEDIEWCGVRVPLPMEAVDIAA